MTANDTISIAVLLSIGSLVVAIIGVIVAIRKANKEDAAEKQKALEAENQRQLKLTENFTKVNIKLDSFTETMNRIIAKSDETNVELRKINDRLIEDKVTIDNHEKRINALELKVK